MSKQTKKPVVKTIDIHPNLAKPASVWDLLMFADTSVGHRAVVRETERQLKLAGTNLRTWIEEGAAVHDETRRASLAYTTAIYVMRTAKAS